MNGPVLVTYATRSGSTAGVAEEIGKIFAASGLKVDVLPMLEVKDLSPYRAIVAGSAIQGQKWLPEAMAFIKMHQAAIARKPLAIFTVCITLSMKNSGQYRQGISTWMDPVRALVNPVSEGMFAGALDFNKMPLTLNTLMMRIPVLFRIWKEGDHRDWAAIRSWANSALPRLIK